MITDLFFLIVKLVDPFRQPLSLYLPPSVLVFLAVAVIAIAVWSVSRCWRRTGTVGRILSGVILVIAGFVTYWELSFESQFIGRLTIISVIRLSTTATVFGVLFIGTVWAAQALFRRSDEQIAAADERRAAREASGDALDWGKLAAFYVPAIVVGGMILIPSLSMLAANLGIGGWQFEQAMNDMTLDRFIFGSAILLPAVVAFGTDLRFKLQHFIIAFVIVVFISFQAANRGVLIEMQGGATPLPAHVAILQALIGLPLTYGLGQLGLKVRALLQRGG